MSESLQKFQMWNELLALAETPYLEPTDEAAEQWKRWRWIGEAQYRLGKIAEGDATLATVRGLFEAKKNEQQKAMEEADDGPTASRLTLRKPALMSGALASAYPVTSTSTVSGAGASR